MKLRDILHSQRPLTEAELSSILFQELRKIFPASSSDVLDDTPNRKYRWDIVSTSRSGLSIYFEVKRARNFLGFSDLYGILRRFEEATATREDAPILAILTDADVPQSVVDGFRDLRVPIINIQQGGVGLKPIIAKAFAECSIRVPELTK
ncbi:hypothetical protein J7U46_12345 [Pelomonas sp. V22]|uniref:hypothetical protein n=1 Tax=Pelomonas sp. V22 TaxID=2822139 RepID=UPI0024A84115|nr:hypothetical protein [Pelomonas sp. V22]MDI4633840.1 hypothetical protein [Pelomonas sp. V22]